MSRLNPSIRARMAGLGGGLVLALSLSSAPVALAQDDGPEATITNLAAAIEAQQFDVLPTFFCEEYAYQAAQFDLSAMLSSLALGLPEGVDPATLAGAFRLVPEIVSMEVVSQTDTEAVVNLVASLSFVIDSAALSPFIEAMLTAEGLEVTPDMVELMTGMLVGEFAAEPIDISDEITLVPGVAMPWVVCDELGGGAGASPEPSVEPSLVPAA